MSPDGQTFRHRPARSLFPANKEKLEENTLAANPELLTAARSLHSRAAAEI